MSKILQIFLSILIRKGTLEVETAPGQKFVVGNGTLPAATVSIHGFAAKLALMLDPELRFGELYMDGRIGLKSGTIYDVLAIASCNGTRFQRVIWLRALARLRYTLHGIWMPNNLTRARRNVEHHYDLDSRLYRLFLDADLQYSCAFFEQACELTLDEAQLSKKRHIAAKLVVEPGDRVLDIGCGWGGMALYLAEICGASVTGITLSREQLSVARQRAMEAGQQERLEFLHKDYREIKDCFDKVVSIGMFEHVGPAWYDAFFLQLNKLLDAKGVALIHTIGHNSRPSPTNPWIAKYIFPGGYIPALSEIMPAIEKAGLIVTDIEILRIHYAETLKHWRDRFEARRAEAAALYDERFCRMWEFYLAGAECAFRYEDLVVFQIQLTRRIDAVPLTREYIASREEDLHGRDSPGDSMRIAG